MGTAWLDLVRAFDARAQVSHTQSLTLVIFPCQTVLSSVTVWPELEGEQY